MERHVARTKSMQGFHAEKLLHHAHADTLQTELQAAVAYATQVAHSGEWVECPGKSAAATKPNDVLGKMTGPLASDSVTLGGTLSNFGPSCLDLGSSGLGSTTWPLRPRPGERAPDTSWVL